MKLALYSSRRETSLPNLVAIQHPALAMLPTILVCPLRAAEEVTNVRTILVWDGQEFTVLCDLARPINRQGLHFVGELDEKTSTQIIDPFLRLLAL